MLDLGELSKEEAEQFRLSWVGKVCSHKEGDITVIDKIDWCGGTVTIVPVLSFETEREKAIREPDEAVRHLRDLLNEHLFTRIVVWLVERLHKLLSRFKS